MSTVTNGNSASKMYTPLGVYVDPVTGKFFVADSDNNRVLIYNQVPTTNNTSADVVVGQPGFGSGGGGNNGNQLRTPYSILVANGKLLISDSTNGRVLVWNSIPTTNGVSANFAIGQTNLTNHSQNQGLGSPTANTLNLPGFVTSDGQRLFIGDILNSRVLIYNSIPTGNNPAADVVIGSSDFTHGGGGAGANTLGTPRKAFVFNNRLFIGDTGNSRVLIFNSIPTVNNASADSVIGQSDFTHGTANQGGSVASNTLNGLIGIQIQNNQLIVADGNSRVLIFNNVISTPSMSISSPVNLNSGKFRISGNVVLGERPYYSLQNLKINVNGQGEGDIVNKDGGNDNGPGSTMYQFWYDIEPWAGSNGDQSQWVSNPSGMLGSLGFTASIKASSYNADEDKVFYFTPFSLDKVKQTTTTDSSPSFSFTVNKNQRSEMKSNLKYYQVSVKKVGLDPITKKEYDFVKYIDNIPVDFDTVKLDPTNLQAFKYASSLPNSDGTYETKDTIINYTNTSSNITVKSKTSSLSPGTYQVQIKAINIMNHEQQSNNLNLTILKDKYPPAVLPVQLRRAGQPILQSPFQNILHSQDLPLLL